MSDRRTNGTVAARGETGVRGPGTIPGMHPRCSIVALLASALPLAGQDGPPLTARSFAPAEHGLAAFVDVAALVDSDFWDTLEKSPAQLLLEEFRRAFGFRLDEVERFDAAVGFPAVAAGADEGSAAAVLVLQGSERVGLGAVDLERLDPDYRLIEVAGHAVLRGSDPAIAAPRPGMLVLGESHHVLGILQGTRRGGVPAPDLLPLIPVGRSLAWFAMLTDGAETRSRLPDWFLADDPPHHLAAQLWRRDADGHLMLTARAGFETGERGPDRLLQQIAGGRALARESPQLRFLDALLERLTSRADGRDLVLELDLGDEPAAVEALVRAVVVTVVASREAAMARMRAAAGAAHDPDIEKLVERIREAQERARQAMDEPNKKAGK